MIALIEVAYVNCHLTNIYDDDPSSF